MREFPRNDSHSLYGTTLTAGQFTHDQFTLENATIESLALLDMLGIGHASQHILKHLYHNLFLHEMTITTRMEWRNALLATLIDMTLD